jgi:hypothetical protein
MWGESQRDCVGEHETNRGVLTAKNAKNAKSSKSVKRNQRRFSNVATASPGRNVSVIRLDRARVWTIAETFRSGASQRSAGGPLHLLAWGSPNGKPSGIRLFGEHRPA